MAPFFELGRLLTLSFTLPYAPRRKRLSKVHRHGHAAVISPYSSRSPRGGGAPTPFSRERGKSGRDAELPQIESRTAGGPPPPGPKYASLEGLCRSLGATPADLLYLSTAEDGERGAFLSRSARKGGVILRVPISSCLRDDVPPGWFAPDGVSPGGVSEDRANYCNPSEWATRLGASLLGLRLRDKDQSASKVDEGHALWMSMLPNRDYLRASLPVHWPEETLDAALCTALELAVDSSYFARAEAVADITTHFKESDKLGTAYTDEEVNTMCHHVLDIVQTRSCRVEQQDGGGQWGPPLRILAPIFDFINHGSSKCSHDGCANACFGLEGGGIMDTADAALVVRATRDIEEDDEVLIDYGDSARPAWKCLASYGFVPEYRCLDSEGDGGDDCVAEIYVDGVRYEVGPATVPYELVEAAAAVQMAEDAGSIINREGPDGILTDTEAFDGDVAGCSEVDEDVNLLTPAVALRIAKRVSDVAFQLLLEPHFTMGGEEDKDDDLITPEAVIAARLAASLRWSQHQVLLACAVGLRDYAAREPNFL